ncbi:MAG: FAD-dependent oxidoreductase [Verrucomicrobia bacterium]|nr:FAD-dependent oxidoreductase [Verrucomicrobiota bacterium]
MGRDVIVAGGGVAAAVGAARAGAEVCLVERESTLGGLATRAMVGTVCGLHIRRLETESRYVCQGFPREFGEKLAQASGTSPMLYKDGLHFLPYDVDAFEKLCHVLLADAGVAVMSSCAVEQVDREDAGLSSLSVISADGSQLLTADAFVDATGNAILTTLVGEAMTTPERPQASAIVFVMQNVASVEPQHLRMNVMREIKRATLAGELPSACERLSIIPGSQRHGTVAFKLGLPMADPDPRAIGLELINHIVPFLVGLVPTFNRASLARIAPAVGVRSANRPMGQETLQTHTVISAGKCGDGVARGAWPIEFWDDAPGPHMTYFAMDDYYEIPAGALCSHTMGNLFFAGKSFSASESAMASARVMGTCLATGYAAGLMAAYQVGGRSRGEAIRRLRSELDGDPA